MELRRARPEELAALGELTVAAYADFTDGPDDPYVTLLRDAASRDAHGELWVAVEGEELLGCVTCCPPGSPWRELAGEHEGEFRMLAVAPSARGRGVGAALAALGEERARAHGASAMVLSSLPEMEHAHRIYTRLGYRRAPARDWDPAPGVHLIAFVKELAMTGTTTLQHTVGEDDTALAVGSGSLAVLGTPRLLAWCEAATCAALEADLGEGETSVGTRVQLEHLAASPVGARIEVSATTSYADGRLRRFTVSARDLDSGKVLAAGEVTRVVVDAERFLSRL
jgi:predicted thioesterase/ribosomal protein S18 acetylase RimI-like enzyme